ncbi:MAG: hypothetical protein E4H36_01560 [Spirochaetales bacterium]|nr:MAG: hypothetical protein E4H36_01560 [Spirochaetales bacterium]
MFTIHNLKQELNNFRDIAGFTGAGISTDSGIPDFRSKGGIWDRYTPVYFNEFLASEEKRLEYWREKIDMWPAINAAVPGKGHLFFHGLFTEGRLAGLITQNIDGLHEKSGLPGDVIVNLHGSNLEIVCLSCGRLAPSGPFFAGLDITGGAPRCPECGGLLKPNTISFGQNLSSSELKRAEAISGACDCMVVMGSTLVVHPAAGFPAAAKRAGAFLVIVTLSETPLDNMADAVFHMPISEFTEAFTEA